MMPADCVTRQENSATGGVTFFERTSDFIITGLNIESFIQQCIYAFKANCFVNPWISLPSVPR